MDELDPCPNGNPITPTGKCEDCQCPPEKTNE